MTKEEAKLKLIMILSNKDLKIKSDRMSPYVIMINDNVVFSIRSYVLPDRSGFTVETNDNYKATYIFHTTLRDILDILDDKEVCDIVQMKKEIGQL